MLSGFVHRTWTARTGAPGEISDFAQTADGMLWLASVSGLFQFDGIRFLEFHGKPQGTLSLDSVQTLYAPRTGGLWAGLRYGGLVFIKEGNITEYPPGGALPSATVNALVEDGNGVLWASTMAGVVRFLNSRWEALSEDWGLPPGYIMTLSIDRSGAIWACTKEALYVLQPGARRFTREPISLSPKWFAAAHGTIRDSPDGTVWVTDLAKGTQPVRVNRTVLLPEATAMLFDREGTLWYSTGDDVRRILNAHEVAGSGAAPVTEQFGRTDGLSGNVNVFFKDREGDIWVGSGEGIDLFVPTSLRMVRSASGEFALARARDGSMWWSEVDFKAVQWHIKHFSDGQVIEELSSAKPITCAYADEAGNLWFAGRNEVWSFDGRKLNLVPSSDAVPGVSSQALVRARDGSLWRSVVRGGVFRYANGEWQRNGGLTALPQDQALVMAADELGRLWFGYTSNRLALVDGNTVKMLGPADGVDVGNVTAIETRGRHVWVGGEYGLRRLDGSRFVPVRVAGEDPYRSLWGVVETRAGELWAAGGRTLIRLDRSQLAEVLAGRVPERSPQLFDYRDGVIGSIQPVRPLPALREAADGRVWFALANGLGFVDPAHIRRNTAPPPVLIRSVSGGGREYSPYLHRIQLPIHTTQLQIGYTAASFAAPERIVFRYRLEGLDKDWQRVGEQREAVYTNLSPGRYRFQIEAANRDSPWSEPGASLELTIPPAFYQTRWFHVFCALVAATLLGLLYRLRLRQVTTAVRARLEERIVERERIARDLHDTLLQGLQGLILRFQAVAARIPPHEPARDMLEQALTRADDVLLESRHRVKDLRASTQMQGDLAEAIGAFGTQLAQERATEFSVAVEGVPRAIHPILRDEVFMIGREALLNAFRHSGARKVEVEVAFPANELRLRVRDDGCGVEPEVLAAGGRSGHWGLKGMRERAKKIRSQLEIWSRPGAGTEVELRVPASMAYRDAATGQTRGWWRVLGLGRRVSRRVAGDDKL